MKMFTMNILITNVSKSVFESIEGTYISLNVSTTSTSFDVVHNLEQCIC